MFSDTIINYEKTMEFYRYSKIDLEKFSYGSRKMVVVECLNCHRVFHKEFRNSQDKHQCPIVNGNNKKCFKCGEWKDLSMFNKSPKLSGGVSKMCRECHNSHPSVKKCESQRRYRIKHSLKNNLELYIRRRMYSTKYRCARDKVLYDLDFEYMNDLWNKQGGQCYYSNIIMDASMQQSGFQSWNAPSIDRKDSSLGYTKGNVVWCIFGVNSFKQNLNEEEFKVSIKKIKWWFNK